MRTIKILTLNTGDSMFEKEQVTFLRKNNFDLICLQEISPIKIHEYETVLEMHPYYQMTYRRGDGTEVGIGILSKFPFVKKEALIYGEKEGNLMGTDISNRVAIMVSISPFSDGDVWNVLNTHFTWSPDGLPNDKQRRHVRNFLQITKKYDSILLCGDFNAPRGGEIFDYIATEYNDNVPYEYTTSIDSKNHRAGHLDYMVDGIFSTKEFKVSGFKMQSDLSDHLGLIADIEKIY